MMRFVFSRRRLSEGMATAALVPAHLPRDAATSPKHEREPVDYVDPNIGGIGQLLSATNPNVMLPYGMMTLTPITTPGVTGRNLADKLLGFPAGGATPMPMTGAAETNPAKYTSDYDHDLESATPYHHGAAPKYCMGKRAGSSAAVDAAMKQVAFEESGAIEKRKGLRNGQSS